MGLRFTQNIVEPVNYNCFTCMEEGRSNTCMEEERDKLPNIARYFYIINQKQYQCNECCKIYPKN